MFSASTIFYLSTSNRKQNKKKSFKSFEKSINKKDWYNENWIGYVIAIIVFLFSIYQYVDNRSLKNENKDLKIQYEIYKDSTYQLNKELSKLKMETEDSKKK